jgi:hypothetical protein
MCFSSSNNSISQLQQQQTAALNQGGANIQKAYQGFTPQFYQGVSNAYIDQANPQLASQYRATGQNLDYNLADRGITNSSAAQNLGSSLQSALAQGQQQVANQGQQAAQNLQQQVANQESQLYGELQTSQNPSAIGQSAANLAAQTAAPSTFAPVGNLFSNWSNLYLANQANNLANTNQAQTSLLYPTLFNNAGISSAGVNAPNYGG